MEEINHAGEGGLYADYVQDGSFDGLVRSPAATAPASLQSAGGSPASWPLASLLPNRAQQRPVPRRTQDAPHTPAPANASSPWSLVRSHASSCVQLLRLGDAPPMPGVDPRNRTCAKLSGAAGTGLINHGFWGIPVSGDRDQAYLLSLHLARASAAPTAVTVALLPRACVSGLNPHGAPSTRPHCSLGSLHLCLPVIPADALIQSNCSALASAEFFVGAPAWQRHSHVLHVAPGAHDAVIAVQLGSASAVLVDNLSLLPLWTAAQLRAAAVPPAMSAGFEAMYGHVAAVPFRYDLLMLLKALKPRFTRVPGGCYVEGAKLDQALRWKDTIGPPAARKGHWNLWGYWSSDRMGMLEYLLLSELLDAPVVWVFNSGMAHQDSVPPKDVMPWIQDALDGIEFMTGAASTEWGSLRARLGHPEPFDLLAVAVGNEDSARPWYAEIYGMFYAAIKARHPGLQVVANAPLPTFPVDVFDYHVYTDAATLFAMRSQWDTYRGQDGRAFVSEFAVTVDADQGNFQAALAEAAYMTGLERNADVVAMASYAPLLVRAEDRRWNPDLITFDNFRAFGGPSYHVARMFAESYSPFITRTRWSGRAAVKHWRGSWSCTGADGGAQWAVSRAEPDSVTGSGICESLEGCSRVHVRLVSALEHEVNVQVIFTAARGVAGQLAAYTLLTGEPHAGNTFDRPNAVVPVPGNRTAVHCLASVCHIRLPAHSINFFTFKLSRA